MSLVGQNGDEIYGGDDDLFEIGDDEFDGKDLSKTLLDCIGWLCTNWLWIFGFCWWEFDCWRAINFAFSNLLVGIFDFARIFI